MCRTNEVLVKGLRAVAFLMTESKGVTGLRRNGAVATWDELMRSSGLEDFEAAMNALIDADDEEAERERDQHEIRMTEDKHYADGYRRRMREESIATRGIDED